MSTKSVVQDRFAKEHGCPAQNVTVEEPAGARYGVHGCDTEATYVCSHTLAAFRGGVQCVEQGLPSPPGSSEGNKAVPPPLDPRIPLAR